MGVGGSRLSKADAMTLAGQAWNEKLFDSLPKDSKGTVSKKELLKLQKRIDIVREMKQTSDETPKGTHEPRSEWAVTAPVPLGLRFGTHVVTKGTVELLADVGGKEKIVAMVTRFYNKAFEDQHLDQFIARHDDPHGERLGLWIAEKMGDPEGEVWTNTRPRNARQIAHRDAWNSPKREKSKLGRRFKLDDCRVWMRLMFWACREEGLMDHPAFGNWFVQFIGHFIAIYERSAPPYAQESADWSANSENIKQYYENQHLMRDIVPNV